MMVNGRGDKFGDPEAPSDRNPRADMRGWQKGKQVLNHRDFYDRLGTLNFILKNTGNREVEEQHESRLLVTNAENIKLKQATHTHIDTQLNFLVTLLKSIRIKGDFNQILIQGLNYVIRSFFIFGLCSLKC